MTKRFDGDPLDALHRVDPLDHVDVPSDASGPRARALFERITATDPYERPMAPVRSRTGQRVALALGGAAVVLVAVTGALVVRNNGTGGENIAGGVPISSSAMCLESYDLSTLATREIAFDGTLVESEGSTAIFEVHRWFTGGTAPEVRLSADGLLPDGGVTLGGEPLQSGARYLVSGSGGAVWACGFTMTYDTATAVQWADVFGG
jgi:hypothetical protein